MPSPENDRIKKEDPGNTLHKIMLRDKFLVLSKSLEDEISSVIESHMKEWRDENLPSGVANSTHSSSGHVTTALTRKLSTKQKKGTEELPSREFVARPSLLTELLNVSHFQSVYNLFGAILFILFLQTLVEEVFKTGRVDLRFSYLYWAFGKLDKVFMIWLSMKFSTLVGIYLGFHYWAHNRHKAPGVYDVIGAIFYATYLFFFLQLPAQSLLRHNLPPASSMIVLCEQVRLFMKTWAFVRTNITRVLYYKKDDDNTKKTAGSLCPNFSQYLYFLFAPTLVYRDDYPRTELCNWKKVVIEFGQVIGCIMYVHFLLSRFCGPVFEKFGKEEFSFTKLVMAVFASCFPASLVLLCGFFLILHAWMNAFAEMFGFADRLFYKDWWNSTSYPRFYRTWNCVVHDWLYEYVYKELRDWQVRRKGFLLRLKFLPMLVVFFISSIVHEYILSFAFKFFYPVLLIMFGGFGVLFMFFNTKERFYNVFIWVSLVLGAGILMCLYSIEWYARINCPPVVEGVADYFVPRTDAMVPPEGEVAFAKTRD